MEDIKEMKILWQDMNDRLINLEMENRKMIELVKQSHYKSTQEKLVRKYAGFIIVEVIMIVFMSFFFIYNPEINEKYRIPVLIYWDIFFLMEVAADIYLMFKIKNINIYESSIKEIVKKVANNWKLHKICIAAGLPIAIGAVILFALAIDANEFVIFGMIVGGLVGLIIGGYQLFKFRNYYNLLKTLE